MFNKKNIFVTFGTESFSKRINSFLDYILPPEKSIDIDLEEDWKLAEIIYKGLNKNL